jgi:putative membrane protein
MTGMAGGPVSLSRLTDGRWRRLHPLSPVVRSGRAVLALVVALGATASFPGNGSGGGLRWIDLVILPVVVVAAVVNWLVTRWKLDGPTLRIETGLLRRESLQLPVARIQAVDLVRPFLARALGLAELRVRLAGSSHDDGRLAYLTEGAATELRARLLAAHHGLDPATPEPAEQVMIVVQAGRLIASVALSASGLACAAVLIGVALATLSPVGLPAVAGTLVWSAVVCLPLIWRQVSAQYGFTLAASPDGIRIRRGLLGTVAETIPVARVQAVHKVEPLLWRPLGWCRLEVDIAGTHGHDKAEGTARERKSLVPVASPGQADFLLGLVIGATLPMTTRPPRRAFWKAPLSYHFLAAGYDETLAIGVTGRLRRQTTVVPLAKAQSIRFVQGPVQRGLALGTVHLDAAGRRVRAEFRDRAIAEATGLVSELAMLSRRARLRFPAAGGAGRPLADGAGLPVTGGAGVQAAGDGVQAAGDGVQAASDGSAMDAAQSEA